MSNIAFQRNSMGLAKNMSEHQCMLWASIPVTTLCAQLRDSGTWFSEKRKVRTEGMVVLTAGPRMSLVTSTFNEAPHGTGYTSKKKGLRFMQGADVMAN